MGLQLSLDVKNKDRPLIFGQARLLLSDLVGFKKENVPPAAN